MAYLGELKKSEKNGWAQFCRRLNKQHILVCLLACVLWKTLAQWMRRAGLGDAPRTLVEEFAKIKSGDVVLKARSSGGPTALAHNPERTIRLRCVTTPDEAQKALLNRLGLTLTQRLRTVNQIKRMQ